MSRPRRPTSSSRSNCSGGVFDWEPALRKLDELNARVEDPTLWDNPDQAQAISRERSRLAAQGEAVPALERDFRDAGGFGGPADGGGPCRPRNAIPPPPGAMRSSPTRRATRPAWRKPAAS